MKVTASEEVNNTQNRLETKRKFGSVEVGKSGPCNSRDNEISEFLGKLLNLSN